MNLLTLKNISKSFFGIQVLFDVNFELKPGEIHCLIGENGAGKSTLIKILTGVYPDYTGEILVDGKLCGVHSPRQSRECGIFSVQQHRDLVPTMNAVENMFLGNFIRKNGGKGAVDMETMRQKTADYLRDFNAGFSLDTPVGKLKVGEQGIIAICKAIASQGKILLIDEASAPLDNFERGVLYKLLRSLRDEGKGIVYITHHLEEVFEIGDRVTVLRNGGNVWTKDSSESNREDLISAMTGNKMLYVKAAGQQRNNESEGKQPLIRYRDVSSKQLDHVTLDVYPGEAIGFAGLEGSGKDEVAEIIFGIKRHKSGEILYKGNPVHNRHPIQAIRNGIGFVPTDRKEQGLIICRNLAENIALPTLNKQNRVIIRRKWMDEVSRNNVEALGIKAVTSQLVEYLSGGNQQKVLIAKWIQAESEVLFLIEPTEGIDVGARTDIYKLLQKMKSEGKTLLIFSSDIDELIVNCNRIYTMAHGRIIAEYDDDTMEKNQILSDILISEDKRGVAG